MNVQAVTESEAVFLGAAIYDNAIMGLSILDDTMFTRYRVMAKRVYTMAGKTLVTPETLLPYRDEIGREAFDYILDFVQFQNWEFHQEIIYKGWAERQAKEAFRLASSEGYPECLDTVDKMMTALLTRHTGAQTRTVGDVLVPTMERIVERRRARGKIPGISFGLEAIDSATLGAQDGQLIVIGARPSEGKSALANHLVRNMSREVKVGLFTIESDAVEFTTRMLAGEAGLDSRKLQTGAMSETDAANLELAVHRIAARKQNVLIHDQAGIKLSQIQTIARRMVREGVRVIFVDYLQLIRIPGSKDRFAEVSGASLGLKELARELRVPIVALAQLGRDSDNRRPGLGDFQYSSQIEQDADGCWMIWHEREGGKIIKSTIIIGKARDGLRCDVPVRFDAPTLSFYEIEEERV